MRSTGNWRTETTKPKNAVDEDRNDETNDDAVDRQLEDRNDETNDDAVDRQLEDRNDERTKPATMRSTETTNDDAVDWRDG